MVVHQNVGVQHDTVSFDHPLQQLDEMLTVAVGLENLLPPHATRGDMVPPASKMMPQLSCHADTLPKPTPNMKP
jgi:hypothetical protein